MITFSSAVYEEYTFPMWADALGLLIGLSTLVPMPLFALHTIFFKQIVSIHFVTFYIKEVILNRI